MTPSEEYQKLLRGEITALEYIDHVEQRVLKELNPPHPARRPPNPGLVRRFLRNIRHPIRYHNKTRP